jgi:hypothetical protein
MIAGLFHEGSGLGNQLHRYVATRVLAKDKGYDFGMIGSFKGESFMNIDFGVPVHHLLHEWSEKKVVNEFNNDVRPYDASIVDVKDWTLIDGEFQDERYFMHRIDEVRDWLKVAPLDMPDDLCVIGFRGGEYVGLNELFLPIDYWNEATERMRSINPDMRFEVHTDDPYTARQFFHDSEIVSDMARNWSAVRYAKHLIIANSSFYILPSLLNQDVREVIAPEFWAGHNKGYWQLPQNQYSKFTYI